MKDAQGKIMRLAWEAPAKQNEKAAGRRALPAGTYTLTGYRILRCDDDGDEWFTSTILAHYDQHKIKVVAGKVLQLKIDPAIDVSCEADATSKYIVRSFFKGMHGAGLTIYKNGKRIPLGFKITSPDGKALESKAMKYG